jgi:hypothetical protein
VKKAQEQGVVIGRKECIELTKAFCEQVTSLGFKAGIYSNMDFYNRMYSKDLIEKYAFWCASWNGSQNPPLDCDVWQYTSKGQVNGIEGNVDLDWFFVRSGRSADVIIKQAQSWIGCKEDDGSHRQIIDTYNSHKPLARGYAVKYTDSWCATFVSACAIAVGYTDIIPTECGAEEMVKLFQKMGRWCEDDNHVPAVGEIIFFDWDDKGSGDCQGWSDHVGIVEQVNGSVITTIEGNKNDSVGRRTIQVGAKFIRGFGVPDYDKASKKSVDELAQEVINGLWGNGQDRITSLQNAGYDAQEVQKRVNSILLDKKSIELEKVANRVIQGDFGNGSERVRRLTEAGYDAKAVQQKVNELLSKSVH